MKFEDLYEIDNPEEKKAKTIEFYLREVKVDKWMKHFPQSVFRFKDRQEYRKNNKLHRLDGPAIEYYDNQTITINSKVYFIDGEEIGYNDWLILSKRMKLNKKLKKIKES